MTTVSINRSSTPEPPDVIVANTYVDPKERKIRHLKVGEASFPIELEPCSGTRVDLHKHCSSLNGIEELAEIAPCIVHGHATPHMTKREKKKLKHEIKNLKRELKKREEKLSGEPQRKRPKHRGTSDPEPIFYPPDDRDYNPKSSPGH